MAIEVLNKTAMAYQGSVPGAESVKATGDSIKVSIPQERTTGTKKDNALSALNRNAVNADNSSKDVNSEAAISAKRLGMDAESIHEKQNERIKKAVDEMNRNARNSEAIFGIHDATNRVTIKIVDKGSKKVLKEYPPERTLDMIAKVWELAGLMVDEKR